MAEEWLLLGVWTEEDVCRVLTCVHVRVLMRQEEPSRRTEEGLQGRSGGRDNGANSKSEPNLLVIF